MNNIYGVWNGERFLSDDHGITFMGTESRCLQVIDSMVGAEGLSVKVIATEQELVDALNTADRSKLEERLKAFSVKSCPLDLLKLINQKANK